MQNSQCTKCKNTFPIFEEDLAFYKKMNVPTPTHCPKCREARRLAWRNEWKFYKRTCDLTGEKIISYISPESKQRVYSLNAWFSDKWERRATGRDYDFSRPFFEQFKELLTATPHIPLLMGDCENSLYTNYSWKNKNCYMISASDFNQDSYYSAYLEQSRDCADCLWVSNAELCYECTDCEKCYDCDFCQTCKNCQTCEHCTECSRCADCFGCINLRDKKFCVLNKQLTREEYESKKAYFLKNRGELEARLKELRDREPVMAIHNSSCENCAGDTLINCKRCFLCFDLIDSIDCRYVTYGLKAKDCTDMNGASHCELMYESVASPECYNCRFCSACWVKSSNLDYCHLCRACTNCFGCVSLYRNSYCILNKQYTKEEYESLLPKIIEHMKSNGEWGEFFSDEVSPFS